MIQRIANFQQVSKSFGELKAVDNLTFELFPGEAFALLGHNGAGKTTSIRMLLGLLKPDTGQLELMGHDPYPDGQVMDDIRRKVGVVQEEDRLYLQMTAIENLTFWLGLYGFPTSDRKNRAIKSLQQVGLENKAAVKVGTFSKGMRRRLALARALALEPQLLILDEPTIGLDPEARVEIRNLLEDLVHQNGLTLLMTSHDLDEVEKLCGRMIIIEHGHAILEGKLEDLRKQGKPVLSVELSEPLSASVLDHLSGELSVLTYVDNLKVEESALRLTLSKQFDQVPSEVIASLTRLGIKFTGINFEKRTLEDIYLQAMEPEIGAANE
jgi:ABC-2 type transport system ATP-binding protein